MREETGSPRRARRVAFVSVEVAPFAKVGGLGDVAGSLPLALRQAGTDVVVVMPRYGSIDPERYGIEKTELSTTVRLGRKTRVFRISRALLHGTVPVLMLGNADLFGDPRVYIDERDRERFFFFSRAALSALTAYGFQPDILHCNDWHTGMAAVWHRQLRAREDWWSAQGNVLTIHNVAHQGITDVDYARQLGYAFDDLLDVERERYPNTINVLARAVVNTDIVTTVSPEYARELQTPAFGAGLDPLFRRRASDLHGILNGIDVATFNPATDQHIAAQYSVDDLSGKAICKRQLQEEAGLAIESGAPLIGMVSRIDDQKGFDLIVAGLDRILSIGAQFVLLGTGDPRFEEALTSIGRRYPGQARIFLKFDVALAQRIYAGSDIFLMPSRFEPCGLGQMIAMRYGTIPVVRKTGGLADTVEAWDASTGTGSGILFTGYNVQELVDFMKQALATYRVSSDWRQLIRNAMTIDFSWVQSARRYLNVYDLALQAGVRVGFDTVKGKRESHGGHTAN